MRIKMVIAYDGSGFHGWQIQPDAPTVQESLQGSLTTLFGTPVGITAAGRTDAGVHASGQVIHFDMPPASTIPPHKIPLALHRYLDPAIVILGSEPVSAAFHACFDAAARHYRYRFVFPPIYPWDRAYRMEWPHDFDRERALSVLRPLAGTHDFTSFSLKDCDVSTRTREMRHIGVEERGDGFDLVFTANGFLRRMIRMIAGTFLMLYPGEDPSGRMRSILETRDNAFSGPPALPGGLYLERVDYT